MELLVVQHAQKDIMMKAEGVLNAMKHVQFVLEDQLNNAQLVTMDII